MYTFFLSLLIFIVICVNWFCETNRLGRWKLDFVLSNQANISRICFWLSFWPFIFCHFSIQLSLLIFDDFCPAKWIYVVQNIRYSATKRSIVNRWFEKKLENCWNEVQHSQAISSIQIHTNQCINKPRFLFSFACVCVCVHSQKSQLWMNVGILSLLGVGKSEQNEYVRARRRKRQRKIQRE